MAGPSTNRARSSTLNNVLLAATSIAGLDSFCRARVGFLRFPGPNASPEPGRLGQGRTSTIRADAVRPAEQSRAK